MNHNALYAPRQNYLAPFGEVPDTVVIQKGDAVTFSANGNDQNGNLSGADWYIDGVSEGSESITPTTNGTVNHTITFNTAGYYQVEGRLHDATSLYTPQAYVQKRWVEVNDTLINLALGKSASQSTTVFNAPASRAVDGNRDGTWAGGSLTHTSDQDPSTQAWWQVDLGAIENIRFIKIYNRTDVCCMSRLSKFHVFVSDIPFTGTTIADLQAQLGVSDYYYAGSFPASGSFTIYRTGRYVRVQLETAGVPLHLAEVEVYPYSTSGSGLITGDLSSTKNTAESESINETSILLYPNPVTDTFRVDNIQNAVLSVISLEGTPFPVSVSYQSNFAIVDARGLPTGFYQLNIQTPEYLKTLKFLKQ